MKALKHFFKPTVAALFLAIIATESISEQLRIRPVYQQTIVWCWAAVSEMVLRYYGVPNLNPAGNCQCGVVGSLGGVCSANCGACVTAIGSTYQMAGVLRNYQQLAKQYSRQRFRSFDVRATGRLSPSEIENTLWL